MDELLRAYAKKRREQAEPTPALHPVSRKLLQDEVRRTFGTSQAQSGQIGLGAWLAARRRLVAVGGAAVVLFVVVTILFAPSWNQSYAPRHSIVSAPVMNSPPAMKLDLPLANRSESAAAPETGRAAAAASPAPPMESNITAKKTSVPEADTIPLSGFGVANSPAPASPPETAAILAPEGAASRKPSAQVADAITPPPVAAPLIEDKAKVPATALPSQGGDAAGVTAQNFVQINALSRSRALQQGESNVLSSFQMDRVGANVRIIDADGSVYKGEVLGRPSRGGGGGFGSATSEPARALKDSNGNANWAFKVSGTNKNLQQNVVFIGNVLDMPAPGAATAATAASGEVQSAVQNRNAPQFQNAQNSQNASNARRFSSAQNPQFQAAQNSLITGKVQVGGGKEFKIEAKPSIP